MLKKAQDIFNSKNLIPLFISACLFIPLFFHGPRFGIPYIKGGDEPHYLVMINSLLMDGDLNLLNNYESARRGSWQLGKKFAGQPVDPHVVWNVNGKQVLWSQVYEGTSQWTKDPAGYYVPEKRKDAQVDVSGLPAYSSHPAGIAFLLAPILWLFRGTPLTEPFALLFSNISVILSSVLFRRILQRYTKNDIVLNLGTLLTFLGMPLWAYGRTLFMEPFLLLFALSAYFLGLEKRSGFWVGMALGLGALLKPNFLILFFPIGWLYLKEKRYKTICWMMVGPILSTSVILYTNASWYGFPFTPAQPFRFGNPFSGMLNVLFSWNHGILPFAPVVILSLLFWKDFFHEHRSDAFLLGSGFTIYFLMMSLFECWWGGWCFGPRLVSPVLAFLMVPIINLPGAFIRWSKPMKWAALILCILSIGINLLGALDGYWDSHPITIFMGNIS